MATGDSTLTLLDSQSLDTVASIAIPARIPYGFHGNWLPG
jgi:carotenoid cleavage dioxygenase